jgi:hypothetical protein
MHAVPALVQCNFRDGAFADVDVPTKPVTCCARWLLPRASQFALPTALARWNVQIGDLIHGKYACHRKDWVRGMRRPQRVASEGRLLCDWVKRLSRVIPPRLPSVGPNKTITSIMAIISIDNARALYRVSETLVIQILLEELTERTETS